MHPLFPTKKGSATRLMLTTEALVAEIPVEKKASIGGGHSSGGWKACTKNRLSAIGRRLKSEAALARAGPFFVRHTTVNTALLSTRDPYPVHFLLYPARATKSAAS